MTFTKPTGTVREFDKIVSSSKSNTESFSAQVLELKDLGKITSQIATLTSLVEVWLQTVDKNGERLTTFSEQIANIESFGAELTKAKDCVSELQNSLNDGHLFSERFITSVNDLESVLDEFVRISKLKLRTGT